MTGSSHEAMPRLFQSYPELFSRVFELVSVGFSTPTSITALPQAIPYPPDDHHVETLLRVEEADSQPFLVGIQAQNVRDSTRHAHWALCVTALPQRYGVPATLLIVSQDRATAEWAAAPASIGYSLTLHPMVLGPHNMPMITDTAEARKDLAMAALSAITHADDPGVGAILKALSEALRGAPDSGPLVRLTAQGLGDRPAAQQWRDLVAVDLSFYKSPLSEEIRDEGRTEGRAEGRVAGRAEDILFVLEQRGVDVPEDARERITGCDDPEILLRWLARALTTPSAEGLFADE